ncbi:MAG: CHRD domain-containing protein [Chloroflexota bacterium]|nr:CHRD domain-containing protein [Chloroflexota bacterium]
MFIAVLMLVACAGTGVTSAPPSRTGPLVATRDPTPLLPPTLGTFAFVAELRPLSEVPPVTDAEAACTGQGRFVLRARLDPAGKITSATAQFSFLVRSCPDNTQIILAHIHKAPLGQNGAVVIDSGLKGSAPTALLGGEIGLNVEDVSVSDVALVTDVIANPTGYYLNVHTVLHPQGLLRGQLVHEP